MGNEVIVGSVIKRKRGRPSGGKGGGGRPRRFLGAVKTEALCVLIPVTLKVTMMEYCLTNGISLGDLVTLASLFYLKKSDQTSRPYPEMLRYVSFLLRECVFRKKNGVVGPRKKIGRPRKDVRK